MSEHLAEAQQVEQIKQFLRNYAKPILIGVAVGLAVLFAWRYWQQHTALINAEASASYEHLLRTVAQGDSDAIKKESNQIISNYGNTPYAQQAALILAREAVYDGDYDDAAKQLQWVINNAKTPAIKEAARLRLARVQLAQQQYDDALKTVDIVDDAAYNMAIYEIRGDVLLAKGDQKGALAAYGQALQELHKSDFNYPLLQMKYDDLTGSDAIIDKSETQQK